MYLQASFEFYLSYETFFVFSYSKLLFQLMKETKIIGMFISIRETSPSATRENVRESKEFYHELT